MFEYLIDLYEKYLELGFEKTSIKVGKMWFQLYDHTKARILIDPIRDILFQIDQMIYSWDYFFEFLNTVDGITIEPWYDFNLVSYLRHWNKAILPERNQYFIPLENNVIQSIKTKRVIPVFNFSSIGQDIQHWSRDKIPSGKLGNILNYIFDNVGSLDVIHKTLRLEKPSFKEMLKMRRLRYFPESWWNRNPYDQLEWFVREYGTEHRLYPLVVFYVIGKAIETGET